MARPEVETIVQAVLAELRRMNGEVAPGTPAPATHDDSLVIDLPDPTVDEARHAIGVDLPQDPDGLRNLCSTTSARLGAGRAGPRPRTRSSLLFSADHGVTQDAIYGTVSEEFKAQFDLFTVRSRAADREEYLLRPDLGRQLSDEGRTIVTERCTKHPNVQIVVGDGLSADAVTNNLPDIYPVIVQGLSSAGLTLGTPFFVENARVGVINDVNDIVGADLVLILLGERPGLGIADALSAYMGYQPGPGRTDANRDLVCMITTHGGTNPLEAGAFVVDLVKTTLEHRASGVELKQLTTADA